MRVLNDAHLTYCLNVHPGGTMAEVERAVFHHAVAVRDSLRSRHAFDGPFGVGLWLGDAAAVEILQGDALPRFIDRLAEHDLYVPTMNGFPFGVFHGRRVKQDVYRPDWSDPRRLEHTIRLAEVLAKLLPEGVDGVISTLPITYRAWADDVHTAMARDQLTRLARRLQSLHDETGRRVRIAIEPEPDCLMDDVASVVDFWRGTRSVLSSADIDLWNETIGLCLDTAHAATLFEPLEDVLRAMREEAIPIFKTQLAAAPEAPLDTDAARLLTPFRDEVYLHQTCLQTREGPKLRFADLPDAFEAETPDATWRTHYHVPFTWRPEGELRTTSREVSSSYFQDAHAMGVRCFEVEIYCLGLMLPDEKSVHEMLADDLAWTLDRINEVGR